MASRLAQGTHSKACCIPSRDACQPSEGPRLPPSHRPIRPDLSTTVPAGKRTAKDHVSRKVSHRYPTQGLIQTRQLDSANMLALLHLWLA